MKLLVVIAMLGACAVVPVTKQSTVVGAPRLAAETRTPTGPMKVDIAAGSSTAVVTVSWSRTCSRYYIQTVAHREWKGADVRGFRGGNVSGGNGGGNAALGLLAIIPAAFVVSAIVTGVIVAADRGGTTSFEEQSAGVKTWACPEGASGVAVQLVLPSGAVLEGVTNQRSLVVFQIPADEPSGELVARVGSAVSTPVLHAASP